MSEESEFRIDELENDVSFLEKRIVMLTELNHSLETKNKGFLCKFDESQVELKAVLDKYDECQRELKIASKKVDGFSNSYLISESHNKYVDEFVPLKGIGFKGETFDETNFVSCSEQCPDSTEIKLSYKYAIFEDFDTAYVKPVFYVIFAINLDILKFFVLKS